jgi:hypothetical protein
MAPKGDSGRRLARDTGVVEERTPKPPELPDALDGADLRTLIDAQCAAYVDDVRWSAPRRGLTLTGRDEVRRHLLAEIASMHAAKITEVRRAGSDGQTFHEYSVRFHHSPPGIPAAALPLGEFAELERLRVLTLDGLGRVTAESSIETWSVLGDDATHR